MRKPSTRPVPAALLAVSALCAQVHGQETPRELQGFEVEAISLVGEEISGVLLDRETLARSGIDHVDDLTARAPGLFIASGGNSNFGDVQTLRGIGNTPFFSSPGVLFYIDGVPAGDASTLPLFLEGIENIKILRGPQGHLYGRNAPAGVVDIRTQPPSNEPNHALTLAHSELGSTKAQLTSTGPIRGSWAYSLSATRSSRDGFIHDLNLGRAKNDFDYAGGRFSLQGNWKGLEIQAGTSLERTTEGSAGLVPWGSDKYTSDTNEAEGATYRRDSQWLVTSKVFEWGRLTSTTSRSAWKLGPHELDLDMTSGLLDSERAFARLDQDQEIRTKGLEAESLTDAGSPLAWKAGLFYLDSETAGLSTRTFPMLFGGILMGVDEQATDFTLTEENLAAYASATLHQRDDLDLDLTAGLRIDRTTKEVARTKYSTFALGVAGQAMGMSLPPPIQRKETWSKLLPHIGATWRATPQADLFIRGTLGYKPGGFSAYGDDLFNPVRFDEELNRTWEAGISWRAANGAAAATLTAFQSRIEDYQFEKSAGGTDYVIVNADKAEARGVELELTTFLARNLMVSANYGYNNATFEEHHGYQVDTNAITRTPTDFSGHHLPFAPRHTLSLSAQYFEPDGTFARLEWRSLGETFFDEANALREPAYSLLNASTGRKFGEFEVQLFARNLLNREYHSLIMPLGGPLVGAAPGTPRILGIQIGRTF